MSFGAVMSDQLVNDIATIPISGTAVKTSTKMTAGATYSSPVSRRRCLAVIRSPRNEMVKGGIGRGAPVEAPRPSACGSTISNGLLAGDPLHGRLRIADDGIDGIGRVVGPLQLLQPRTGRIVDLLEERQAVRRPADGQ